ncbi:MAG: hypothetical protein K6G11_06600 [Lachnospiraceae bacterium]|nr:hypothetical protein [Lachnospiraceae bacterium]
MTFAIILAKVAGLSLHYKQKWQDFRYIISKVAGLSLHYKQKWQDFRYIISKVAGLSNIICKMIGFIIKNMT